MSQIEFGSVKFKLNETSMWSDILGPKSTAEQFEGVTPEQQNKSKIWPLGLVVKSTWCCRPKLSKQEVKLLVRACVVHVNT